MYEQSTSINLKYNKPFFDIDSWGEYTDKKIKKEIRKRISILLKHFDLSQSQKFTIFKVACEIIKLKKSNQHLITYFSNIQRELVSMLEKLKKVIFSPKKETDAKSDVKKH